MGDTKERARRTAVAAVAALLLACVLVQGPWAGPSPTPVKVVWTHGDRVYLAARDSIPIEEGDLLTFSRGRNVIATGFASAVHDRELAIARLTSGSLDRVKLDRIVVRVERAPLRAMPVLRVGFPTRSSLLFPCRGWSLKPPASSAAYASEVADPGSYSLVRDSSATRNDLWPDTLLVRLFEEPVDEEIALERGDVDVAVFWPGELSTAMRGDPRWRDLGYGSTRGALVLLAPEGDRIRAADSLAIASLNEGIFRGDLMPLPSPTAPAPAGSLRRFEVDRSCPGWQTIERYLNRAGEAGAAGAARPARVTFSRDGGNAVDGATAIAFTARCPIVGAPKLRSYVRALGPDALVSMLECAP